MTLSKFRASTDPLFEKHDLLKLIDINLYSYAKFMYSWYHNKLPSVFDNSFTYVHDIHPDIETRQSTNNSMFSPKFSRDYGQKCKINLDVTPAVFAKSIKQCIKVGLL